MSACRAIDTNLPAQFANWANPAKSEAVAVGATVDVPLKPVESLTFAVRPERKSDPGQFGGTFGFQIARAGTYRVALGERAWIDVVRDGKAVASTAHGHGPYCSSIRKMVSFPLAAGRYTLQLSGSAKPSLRVRIVATEENAN